MAKQASEPTTRELRQLFGRLYDQAAGLAESLRPCRCDRSAPAEDSQDLNAMVQELLPVRQRVGGCICGPPCDGTSVDNVSNEFLEEMLARLQWDLNVLDENLVPCDCDAKPEVAEKTPEPVVDQTTVPVVQQNPSPLLRLPLEIRNMIWWRVLEPPRPVDRNWPRWYVRVVHRNLKPGENTVGHWFHRPRFSIDRLVTSNGRYRTTFQRHREQYQWSDRPGRWALLFVNRQVYEEAEDQFWRRTFGDGLMLSFRPDDIDVAEHYGILAAWTFFNHYRGLYLDQIRRLQLNLALPATRDPEGRDLWGQALQTTWSFGTSNGADFLVPLLDIMAGELPNLEHLSLTFGGWVPDMREEPVSGSLLWLCVSLLVLTVVLSGQKVLQILPRLLRALCPGLRAC